MREISIPDRWYHAALVTWGAVVVGVVLFYGGQILPETTKQPAVSPVVVDASVWQLKATNRFLQSEVSRLEEENATLKAQLSDH